MLIKCNEDEKIASEDLARFPYSVFTA